METAALARRPERVAIAAFVSTKGNELISHASAFLEIRIMMTKQIMAAKVFIKPSKVSRTQM